jgi:hypothetical protein
LELFAAKWLNQFHHGWLTPLLGPRANVEGTDIAEMAPSEMKELERFDDGFQFFHVK